MLLRDEPLVVVEARPDSHTTWSIQWIMKSQTVAELERVGCQLSDGQKVQYGFERLVDVGRVKLVVALLLGGRKEEAATVVTAIRHRALKWRARGLCLALRLVPSAWTGWALSRCWKFSQDRSFDWQPASAAVVLPLRGGTDPGG